MDQYLLIPFLGGWTSINPSYFDVHQGDRVLTHNHIVERLGMSWWPTSVIQFSMFFGWFKPNMNTGESWTPWNSSAVIFTHAGGQQPMGLRLKNAPVMGDFLTEIRWKSEWESGSHRDLTGFHPWMDRFKGQLTGTPDISLEKNIGFPVKIGEDFPENQSDESRLSHDKCHVFPSRKTLLGK